MSDAAWLWDSPAPLSRRLRATDNDAATRLVSHVENARDASLAAAVRPPAPREPTVRFQDGVSEPPPRRRGFFGRIAGIFGM